jgi:hypothetical protein
MNIRVVCSLSYPEPNAEAQYNIVVWPVFNTFFQLSHSGHDFQKNVNEHKILVSNFSRNWSQTIHIPRRTEGDIIINVYNPPCKGLIIIFCFYSKLNFPNRRSKNT